MAKKSIILMLLIGAFSAAVAQNQEKTREIKLYINGYSYREWAPKNTSYIQDQIKESGFGRISLALQTQKKQHWSHEFEIGFPLIKHTEELTYSDYNGASYISKGNSIYYLNTNARYQLNYHFLAEEKTWSPYLGAATGFHYRGMLSQPMISMYFPESHQQLIVPLELIPGLRINLHGHFALDINIPLQLHQFAFEFDRISNPMLPIAMQRILDYYGVLLPKAFQLRIGLVYKL